jgi:preprotein translocase SecE subunit
MSPITTRSQDEDEDLVEDVNAMEQAESGEARSRQPAMSDSRRRRLRARGIDPDEIDADVEADEAEAEGRGVTAPKGRPTPSRDGEVRSNNIIGRVTGGISTYINDVRFELTRVTWLARPDLLRMSYIVLGVTAATAAFLGLVSFVFGSLTGAIAQGSSFWAGLIAIGIILIIAGGWLLRDRLFPNLE